MNLNNRHPSQDQVFGKRIASYLDQGNQQLSYEITERLRAARTRAIASRRVNQFEFNTAQDVQVQSNGSIRLPFPSKMNDIYSLIFSFIPLICLAAGLMMLYEFHNDQTALELAEIDSALLIDDLPPQAYTDPAFVDFLKNKTLQKD
jgi:hypothetical protein